MKLTPFGQLIVFIAWAIILAVAGSMLFDVSFKWRLLIAVSIYFSECALGFLIAYSLQVREDQKNSEQESQRIIKGN